MDNNNRIRKNYRFHWTTIKDIEYLESIRKFANETDIVSQAIKHYADHIREQRGDKKED